MTEETMMAESPTEMACPKDGTAMAPLSRRGRGAAYRCPECMGLFFDVEAVRRRRAAQPPMWSPFVMSVLMSVGMTLLVRRLRHRSKA